MKSARAFLLAGVVALGALPAAAGCPEGWKVQGFRGPRHLWAGTTTQWPLELANLSNETWSEAAGDHLAYHWRTPEGEVVAWDGDRTQLPGTLLPGESVRLAVRVRAPRKPGSYLLELGMVREQVCWYRPPLAGRYQVLVRVWPREPFLAGGVFLATLAGLILARWARGKKTAAVLGLFPALWLVGLAWSAGELFAIGSKSEGVEGFHLALGSSACLLACPVLLVPRRFRGPLAAMGGVLLAVLAFADGLYMRFFGSILPLAAWRGAGQVGRVWESVRSLMAPTDAWYALLLGSSLAMLAWPRGQGERQSSLGRWLAAFAAVALLLAGVPSLRRVVGELRDPAAGQVFSLQQKAATLGLWGAHLFDVGRTVQEAFRGGLAPEEKAKVLGFFAKKAQEAPAEQGAFGVCRGANLLLIQVESLQSFVVGLSVNGQEVTPFLNRLAKKGLYFSWVFDQTNQGRSSDGEFMAMNSQHPLAEGAAAFRAAGNRFLALPELLRRHGYHTLSAHPFERGFWNRAVLHPKYGFSRMFFKEELGPGEVIGWGLADGVFFAKMLPVLQRTEQPFFAFLITLGLHHPFDGFPAARKMLDLPELGDPALANYLQAMRYFDASLEQLFQGLEQASLLPRTVVALYGDHEAGIPYQAPLAKLLGKPWNPGVPLWLRRVPFVVVTPNPGLSGEVAEVGGQVDIAPTLLYLLGVPRPRHFVGSALVPGRHAVVPVAEVGAVDEQHLWSRPWGEACFQRLTLEPAPREACSPLVARAAEELWASRAVVLHDLVPELAR